MTITERTTSPSPIDLFWSGWPFGIAGSESAHDLLPVRVEEFTDGGDWVVRAELPGIDPDKDVEVHVDGGALTISAERREETSEGERGKPGYRSEFRYGSYQRSLRLPTTVTAEQVKATYADGILEVRIPGAVTPTEPAKVPVTRG
jgi:HSP20 family protein